MDEKTAFKEHYRREAEQYDKRRYGCVCQQMYSDLQKEAALGFLKGCKRIYEGGCGTGRFTIHFALHGMEVVAMDAAPEMLEVARRNAEQAGVVDRIRFVQGDIEDIDQPDESFDGVFSNAVLRHFPSPRKGISELARITRPGGVVVVDYLNKNVFSLYAKARALAGKDPNKPGEEFFRNYHSTLDEMAGYMSACGLRLVERRGFIKLPSHLLLCKMKLGFLKGAVAAVEKGINAGAVVMVKGVKG